MKKIFKIVIILMVVISILISLYTIKLGYDYYKNNEDSIKIEKFYIEQEKIVNKQEEQSEELDNNNTNNYSKENYVAVIKIPKIGLERGIYEQSSRLNTVDKNIQILKESDYPNINNGNFILAAHSGVGKIAYFKNLYKLDLNDEVKIIYNGKEYSYKVVNKYEVDKTGHIEILRNMNVSTLTLTTCKHNTDKQIVVICELEQEVDFER